MELIQEKNSLWKITRKQVKNLFQVEHRAKEIYLAKRKKILKTKLEYLNW